MNKNERIIWDNINLREEDWEDDYNEWMDINEYTEDDVPMDLAEYMYDTNDMYLEDERMNLDKEVDGVIVCLARVGTWMGTRDGYKECGDNVKDILYSTCEYCKWYCDRWNVRSTQIHHDGRNHLLYRVAETQEKADWIEEMFMRGKMDEKKFMRHTKSLRPYVAKVYGW